MAESSRKRNRRVRPVRESQGKRRLWQRGPRWLLPVLSLIVLVGIGILAAGQFLTVKSVEVSGTVNEDAAAVREILGVAPGDRMAGLDTGSMAAAVSQLPWVDTVTVSRAWPSTVKISVVEHIPVGFLKDGGTQILVDTVGRQFFRINAPISDGTDGVDTASLAGVPPGVVPIQASLSDDAAIQAAAEALNALSVLEPEFRGQLSEVDVPAADSITLVFNGDRTVFWGSSERAAEKAEATRVVLRREGARWNVSNPALPAVRG